MKSKSTAIKIAYTALSAAIVYCMTLISFPFVGGYINLGDVAVLFLSLVMSPSVAIIASVLGSTLSDVTLGYFIYAPFTLVIKGIMSVLVVAIAGKSNKKWQWILAFVISSLFMQIGYYFANVYILGGFEAALASVPTNLIQSAVCIPVAFTLAVLLLRIKSFSRKREEFHSPSRHRENESGDGKKDESSQANEPLDKDN